MNGTNVKLKSLSFSDCIVLIESIAGTEHPNPSKIGTMLFPESPILLSGYPL